MNQDIIIFLLLSWVSSLYLSFFIISILQYRVITLFREYWHILIIVIFVYTSSYMLITSFYTLNIAFFGKIPSPIGGKSIPGLLGMVLASLLIWVFSYIVSYVLNGANHINAIKYMFSNPIIFILLVLDVVFLAKITISPDDAVYTPTSYGDVTVSYSDSAILLGFAVIMISSYLIFIIRREIPRLPMFKNFYNPLMVIALVIFSQLIIGEIVVLLSTKLHYSFYPFMNLTYLISSILAIGYFYHDLINTYNTYVSSLTNIKKRTEVRSAVKETNEIYGRILLKVDPETNYFPLLKKWIDKLSENHHVIIITSLTSTLAKYSFKNEENITKMFTITVGMMSRSENTIPLTNLSLMANTVVNLVMKSKDSVVVFDSFIDVITMNSVKEVYRFLKQVIEIIADKTIIVVLNWKALSDQEYALLSSLFNKIYSVETGKFVLIKDEA